MPSPPVGRLKTAAATAQPILRQAQDRLGVGWLSSPQVEQASCSATDLPKMAALG